MRLAYSDVAAFFLNGRLLIFGNSAYQSRDPSFLGLVGFFDHLFLPFREGENEILLLVGETFGGWAFGVQDADAVLMKGARRLWETGKEFATPEAVLWDGKRRDIYVSNYDVGGTLGRGAQTIARVGPDGEMLDPAWAAGLANPTGLALAGERLYAVERTSLVEIDAAAGMLYIGNNGDNTVKAANTATGETRTFARLPAGIIDGIAFDREGNLLVSHWEGRLFRVDRTGRLEKLVDTSVTGEFLADFGYDPERNLLVAPLFYGDRLAAFELED